MERTGGCACGAIRFTITAPFIGTGACHCTDCQKASGGGANYVALTPKGALEVTKGAPKSYATTGESGGQAVRFFCGDCGTPLWSEPSAMPFMPVKFGALDDAADLTPQMHIYASSAPAWHNIPEGATAFPKMPPMPG